MMKLIALIAILYLSHVTADDTKGPQPCSGGYAHGEQMNIGQYWYECRDGKRVPKGCLTSQGNRVEIDQTFDTQTYRMKCVRNGDDFLSMIYVACVDHGTEREAGSQWDDGTAYYTCVHDGKDYRVTMLGCVDQGRQLKFEERVAKDKFIYQCKKSADGRPTLNKVGCVHEGRKYTFGETIEGAKEWYTCTDSGPTVVGCMFESRKLQHGDHFTKGDMMFSCKVGATSTTIEAFACMARDDETGTLVERRIGCFWVEGSYEYTCKEDGNNGAIKVHTQCFYTVPRRGNLKIQPGCVKMADKTAVGCIEDGPGRLRIQTYGADQIDTIPGLRKC